VPPPQVDPTAMDTTGVKTAVEEAVVAALGKIPSLKDLLSSQETQIPPKLPTQPPASSDVARTSLHGKYTNRESGSQRVFSHRI